MKIIPKTISITGTPGPRVAYKTDSFNRQTPNYITEEAVTKINKIPENEQCPSELTTKPCLAYYYVKILKKYHKKLLCRTVHCKPCVKAGEKLSDTNAKEILCKSKFGRICIHDLEAKCPRVKQAHEWLIKCKYRRMVLRKCYKHHCVLTHMLKKANMKALLLKQILK